MAVVARIRSELLTLLLLLLRAAYGAWERSVALRQAAQRLFSHRRSVALTELTSVADAPAPLLPRCLGISLALKAGAQCPDARVAQLVEWCFEERADVEHVLLFDASDELHAAAPRLARRLRSLRGAGGPPLVLGWGDGAGSRSATLGKRDATRRTVHLWCLGASDALAPALALTQDVPACACGPPAAPAGTVSARVRSAEARLHAAHSLPPCPQAVLLVGSGAPSLAGFPAWLAHGAELYSLGALHDIDRLAIRGAMQRLKRTVPRLGR